jgi:hypothetical protein
VIGTPALCLDLRAAKTNPRNAGVPTEGSRFPDGPEVNRGTPGLQGWLAGLERVLLHALREATNLLQFASRPIGICRTRTIAERAAAEKLEKLGINSAQTFIEATSTITFKAQGEIWLKSLANRKRNPLEQTTSTRGAMPSTSGFIHFVDRKLLADANNLAMRLPFAYRGQRC